MTITAIITAAGSSRRMEGQDKLLLPIQNRPLILRTIQPFLTMPAISTIILAVNPERVDEFTCLVEQHCAQDCPRIQIVAGGSHRQHSILYALRALAVHHPLNSHDIVLIHDGARPFVTTRLIQQLLDQLDHFDGVIPAVPVRDTVKRVHGKLVTATEDRETLRMVQTPQAFRTQNILRLHEQAFMDNFLGTDDASLIEQYGGQVSWIRGPIHNLKVTVPEDIAMMEYLFEHSQARNKS